MDTKDFNHYKNELLEKLNKTNHWIEEPNTLLDWFFKLPVRYNLDWSIEFWWPYLLTICLVWNETWRLFIKDL